jgi:hypothetical protein
MRSMKEGDPCRPARSAQVTTCLQISQAEPERLFKHICIRNMLTIVGTVQYCAMQAELGLGVGYRQMLPPLSQSQS